MRLRFRKRSPFGPWLLALLAAFSLICSARAAANISLWDTGKPIVGSFPARPVPEWKPIPADLLELEANPQKAQSDPGYYGREYTVQGDIVLENRILAAHFSTSSGRVIFYPKSDAPVSAPKEFAAFTLPGNPGNSPKLAQIHLLRYTGDEAVLEALFSANDGSASSVTFTFDKTDIITVKPSTDTKSVRLLANLAYAIAPGFVADDLILAPASYTDATELSVPAENLLLGLLPDEGTVLSLAWPDDQRNVKLIPGASSTGDRLFTSIDMRSEGRPFYLALSRPSIWNRERLNATYLEKDKASLWRKPFPAKWKIQLTEGAARTTFAFRDTPQEIWRGVEGSYTYPVWFSNSVPMFHLSKKIPPKGEALIYFTEGRDTPPDILTPADVLKAALGLERAEALIDLVGRSLRTHHRRGGDGVHRACTCGCTEAIQSVFNAGEEVEKQAYINAAVDDMIYFIQRHIARIDEYRRFADEVSALLQARASISPELKPYLDDLAAIVGRIPEEYSVQKDNMKSLAYAAELKKLTLELASRKDPKNRAAYDDLLEKWRGMGGAQDYIVAQCHIITRRLYQEAGYGCVTRPEAVALAREIRARCRNALRNPDGYEIWPDY